MNSIEFLKQVETSNKAIKKQLEKVQEYKYKCLIPSQSYSERVQTSRNVKSHEDNMIRYLTAKEELEALKADREEKKHELITAVHHLEEAKDIEILYLRYVKGLTFKDIAKRLQFNYTWLVRLHKDALKHFQESFEEWEEVRM